MFNTVDSSGRDIQKNDDSIILVRRQFSFCFAFLHSVVRNLISVPHRARLPKKRRESERDTQNYHSNDNKKKLLAPLWLRHYIRNQYILLVTFTIWNTDAGPAYWENNNFIIPFLEI